MESYLHTPMNQQLIYDSIPERLRKFTIRFPKKEAFVFYSNDGQRSSLTFDQLYNQSVKFAKGLVSMGLIPGDIVGLALHNNPDWVVCHFGILFAGCVSMGLIFSQKNGDDVKCSIEKSERCKVLIFEATEFLSHLKIVKNLVNSTDDHGVVLKGSSAIEGLQYVITTTWHRDFPFTVSHVINVGSDDVTLPVVDPDDVCLIFQTSGTTGRQKLVMWTHSGLLQSTQSAYEVFGLQEDDIYFSPGFFTWGGAYIHGFLATGCTYVTVENFMALGTVQNISKTVLDILKKEKCTFAFIVALFIYHIMEYQLEEKLCYLLKGLITSGQPVHHTIGKSIGLITRKLFIGYGATEAMYMAIETGTALSDLLDYSCGPPIPGIEVKVINKDGIIVPRGQPGHVHIRSRVRFQGYLSDPEKTALVFSASGWYNTDDIGSITSNGGLIIFGRETELISSVIGRWFSPYSTENLLKQHKEVRDVAVIPIPDYKAYQRSCACIIRHEGSTASWVEINSVLRESTSAKAETLEMGVLIPDFHVFVDSFPRTVSGKLRKQELYKQIKHLLK